MAVATNETVDYSEDGGEYNDMYQRWEWKNDRGQPHREGDKPALIYDNGTVVWCKDGKLHRLDGRPWNVTSREDDPWFIEGIQYDTEEEFLVARDAYCEEHGVSVSSRQTKRATPGA